MSTIKRQIKSLEQTLKICLDKQKNALRLGDLHHPIYLKKAHMLKDLAHIWTTVHFINTNVPEEQETPEKQELDIPYNQTQAATAT